MVVLTVSVAWPIARLITMVFSFFDSSLVRPAPNPEIHPAPNPDTTPHNLMRSINDSGFATNFGYMILALICIAALIYGCYFVEIAVGKSLIIQIITWTSRDSTSQNFGGLAPYLVKIAQLQGLVAIPFFLIAQNWKKLSHITIDLAITCSTVAFLTVQLFSLLVGADKVYGNLPTNIGGGKPEFVIFYVTPENARLLDSLDDTFAGYKEAIIPANSAKRTTGLVATNTLTLYWQVKCFDLPGEQAQETYFVRPSTCDTCPIVRIHGSSVYSAAYVTYVERLQP